MQSTRTRDEDGVIIQALSPAQPSIAEAWRLVYYPPFMRIDKHSHDTAHFSVLLSGQSRETIHGTTFDSHPMLMEFKPSGLIHSNEFGPDGALLLSINMSPDNDNIDEVFPTRTWLLHHSNEIRPCWTQLAQQISIVKQPNPEELETITLDLLTILTHSDEYTSLSPAPNWLRRARAAIIETNDPIQSIAEDSGVHRVHLSRAFRQHLGQTISNYRREIRLSRAIRLLAHNGETVTTASYAAGFSDQSHLTRTFRQEVGLTPASFSKLFCI